MLIAAWGLLSSNEDVRDHAPECEVDLSQIREPIPLPTVASRWGNQSPYEVNGQRYEVLECAEGYCATGIASWYGMKFHGRPTSNGEVFDVFQMTAAHRTLPIPCYARITHLGNGRSVVVRINDRGPFVEGRILDLSWAAAAKLGMVESGLAEVAIEVVTGT
ncbi:MAG: septal ring lytic transglycosylase RlpA family protein [Puniceicoccaceae bacterium]